KTFPNTPARRLRLSVLVGPAMFWLGLFFLVPFAIILLYSFLSRSATGGVDWVFTLENYARLFGDPIYLLILWRSIWIGGVTTLLCLLIGYPLALFIVRQPPQWRSFYIFLILIPFWTNMLVRTYAWMTILNNTGLINTIITGLGGEPLSLINTQGAVLLGLVYGQLPFMVLPVYAVIERFDFRLMEAAGDLGANRWQAFRRVMLPITMPGIAAGSVLVFILSAGNYIIPALLGGNKVILIGNLLEQQFGSAQNQPLGAATALLVMLVLTAGVIFYFRTTTEEER
ncbi:MAG: ABC transporter permease, partial [Chloroflexaceae bacterium]|nr:ABC transporter permease [Chloroflexaceae bacterium]